MPGNKPLAGGWSVGESCRIERNALAEVASGVQKAWHQNLKTMTRDDLHHQRLPGTRSESYPSILHRTPNNNAPLPHGNTPGVATPGNVKVSFITKGEAEINCSTIRRECRIDHQRADRLSPGNIRQTLAFVDRYARFRAHQSCLISVTRHTMPEKWPTCW